MKVLYANNSYGKLVSALAAADTTITLQAGEGERFPSIVEGSGDWFPSTLGSYGPMEIVKVVARNGDVLTVDRAQEGTTALDWAVNSSIELRLTKAVMEQLSPVGHVHGWDEVTDKPVDYPPSAHNHTEYVAKTGGTMSGELVAPRLTAKVSGMYGMSIPTGDLNPQLVPIDVDGSAMWSQSLRWHSDNNWMIGDNYRFYHQGFKPTPADIGAIPMVPGTTSGDVLTWDGDSWEPAAASSGSAPYDGIRDGVIDTAPTENAVFDALALKVSKAEILEVMFPVGSTVMRMDNRTPTDCGYPGTWSKFAADYAVHTATADGSNVGTTTGSNAPAVPVAAHTHTATQAAHGHAATQAAHGHTASTDSTGGHTHTVGIVPGGDQGSTSVQGHPAAPQSNVNTGTSGAHTHNVTIGSVAPAITVPSATPAITVNNSGTAGATLDVRGARILVNIWWRTA